MYLYLNCTGTGAGVGCRYRGHASDQVSMDLYQAQQREASYQVERSWYNKLQVGNKNKHRHRRKDRHRHRGMGSARCCTRYDG